jgi:uncharacterized GH25 family protein
MTDKLLGVESATVEGRVLRGLLWFTASCACASVAAAQEVARVPFTGIFEQLSGRAPNPGQAGANFYFRLKGAGFDCLVFDPDLVKDAQEQPPKALTLGVRVRQGANNARARITTWIEPDWSGKEKCHPSVSKASAPSSDRADIDTLASSGALLARASDEESVRTPYRAGRPLDVTMAKPRDISGVVVDAEGRVVAGARVQALGALAHEWTASDAAGRFVVRSIGATSAVKAVLSNGRAAVSEIDALNPRIVVTDAPERAVHVTAEGRPVRDALVILRRADLLEARRTNLEGLARIPDLAGADTILVSAKGYREEVRALGSTRASVAIEFRLEPMGLTTVEAVDSLDRPLDTRFKVFEETAWRSEEPMIDRRSAGGTLRLRGTRGEGFKVVLRSPGYGEKALTVQVGLQPRVKVRLSRGLEFSGMVTDIDGRPIAASVVLRRFQQFLAASGSTTMTSFEDEADARTSRTDPTGAFRVTGLEAGLHWLSVRAPGMATFTKEVSVSATSSVEPEAIVLGPGASISGRLFGARGKRRLSARGGDPGPYGSSRPLVEVRVGDPFILSGLVEGTSYDLVVSDPDAPESPHKVTTALIGVVAPATGLEVRLDAPIVVRGRISASDGPLPSTFEAMVCPAARSGLQGDAFCTRGQFGGSENFELEAPGPGTWDLVVQAEGYVPHSTRLTLPRDERVQVALSAGIELKGQVVDNSAKPVPGATVVVNPHGPLSPMLAHWGAGVRTVTDDLGEFDVPAMPGGRYSLTIIHQDYVTETTTLQAKETGRATIVLHKGGILQGAVLEQGRPVPGGKVVIEPQESAPNFPTLFAAREAVIDDEGRFQSRRMPPGQYRLKAVIESSHNQISESAEALVTEGETTTVTLSLRTGTFLRCTVQGLRLGETARVTARGNRTSKQISLTPQNECIFHGIDDGTWLVSVEAFGPVGKRFASAEVVVDSKAPPATVELKLLDASRLHGVVKRGGVAVPGATLVIMRRDTGGLITAPATNATGEFLVENLAPAVYVVAAGLPDGIRKRLEVDLSKADGDIEFSLGSSVLAGMVVDAGTATAQSGVKITIRDTQQRQLFASTQTDSTGAFHIRDLENGTYRLRIQTDDHEPQDIPLTILGNLVLETIRLRPKP